MKKRTKIIAVVIGCICFGAVMALRDSMPHARMKTIVAGIAGAILGLILVVVKGKAHNKK
jgi:uncharacterized protein YacL